MEHALSLAHDSAYSPPFSVWERKYSPFFVIVQLWDLCTPFCMLTWN